MAVVHLGARRLGLVGEVARGAARAAPILRLLLLVAAVAAPFIKKDQHAPVFGFT